MSNWPVVEDFTQNLTWRKALNLDDAATLIARTVEKRKDIGTMTVLPGGETRLQHWLRIKEAKKPRICAQIYKTAEISNLNYWLEIIFSAAIAVLGLVINSPAVIIGAMLISPLMGPIMAMGLALAAGDLYLAIKATANLLASVSLAIGLSAFIVWLLPFHSITTEILARTTPTLLDLGIALFSGLAGSVAVSRMGGGEAVTTLPGVAIAVALMPPLCTIGFGLGSGANLRIMGGAGLLFLTNLVAIVSSAFMIFLLAGMNSPDVRAQMEHSRIGEPLALKISSGPLARVMANSGKLRWRILMLAVLLGSVAVPLRTAFLQVAGEALVRGTVQEAVKGLLPSAAIVSQQVDVGRKSVTIRLISTQAIPAEKLQAAEREIERRSGRKTAISVSTIANQNELAELTLRLTDPPPPAPKPAPPTLEEIHSELIQRIQPVVAGIWPTETPMQNFDVAFEPTGIAVDVQYTSPRELDKISLGLIENELRGKLGVPTLSLNAKRVPEPRKEAEQTEK
jgi:uncharacterized hydrophobic protein (TIGR00271 family)